MVFIDDRVETRFLSSKYIYTKEPYIIVWMAVICNNQHGVEGEAQLEIYICQNDDLVRHTPTGSLNAQQGHDIKALIL